MAYDAYATQDTDEWMTVRIVTTGPDYYLNRYVEHVDVPCKPTTTFAELERTVRNIPRLALGEFENFGFLAFANWEDGTRVVPRYESHALTNLADTHRNVQTVGGFIPHDTTHCVGNLGECAVAVHDGDECCGTLFLHQGKWLRTVRKRTLRIVFLGGIDDDGDYFAKLRHAICMAGSPIELLKSYLDTSAAEIMQFEEYIRESNATITSNAPLSSYLY
jgi:hypothetical protein